MVVIAAGGKKSRLGAVPNDDVEAHNIPVKGDRALEIGDFEMHVANMSLSGNAVICSHFNPH